MNKMKTLTLQGVQFEVFDEQARNDIEVLKENGGAQADLNASEGEAGYVKNRTHYDYYNIIEQEATTIEAEQFNSVTLLYAISNKDIKIPEGKHIYAFVGDLSFELTELPERVGKTVYFASIDDTYGLKVKLSATDPDSGMLDRNNCYIIVSDTGTNTTANPDAGSEYIGKELRVELVEQELKQLDPKFIPAEVPKVATAEVGQTVVVKAVDENGKPTEWETADVGSGGGDFFKVQLSEDGETLITPVADIFEAAKAGKFVYIAQYQFGNSSTMYILSAVETSYDQNNPELYYLRFSSIIQDSGKFRAITINPDGTVTGVMKDADVQDWQPPR